MHTKDKLAEELEKANLPEMAERARKGLYHDFLSPFPFPAAVLDTELARAGTHAAMKLRMRHHAGEFDATNEESEQWVKSREGQSVLVKLTSEMPRQ